MNLCQSRTFKKWHERKAFMPDRKIDIQKCGRRFWKGIGISLHRIHAAGPKIGNEISYKYDKHS